jgi:hypothetical protein
MAALVDQKRLSETQRVELHEGGDLWIIDESTHQEIKLDIQAGARLYELMHFHDHLADLYQDE